MNRDHLYIEQHDLLAQLQGISPKVSFYQEVKKRLDEIEKLLDRDLSTHKVIVSSRKE